MMWSSIENLKQNLNKIALDVHDDDDDELEIHASSNGYDSPVSDRRNSHRFAHSKPVSRALGANGNGSPYNFEIEQYKAQIKRLQESEGEIKALSINYAAILKEKEVYWRNTAFDLLGYSSRFDEYLLLQAVTIQEHALYSRV